MCLCVRACACAHVKEKLLQEGGKEDKRQGGMEGGGHCADFTLSRTTVVGCTAQLWAVPVAPGSTVNTSENQCRSCLMMFIVARSSSIERAFNIRQALLLEKLLIIRQAFDLGRASSLGQAYSLEQAFQRTEKPGLVKFASWLLGLHSHLVSLHNA